VGRVGQQAFLRVPSPFVLGPWSLVLGTWYLVLGTWYWAVWLSNHSLADILIAWVSGCGARAPPSPRCQAVRRGCCGRWPGGWPGAPGTYAVAGTPGTPGEGAARHAPSRLKPCCKFCRRHACEVRRSIVCSCVRVGDSLGMRVAAFQDSPANVGRPFRMLINHDTLKGNCDVSTEWRRRKGAGA